MADHTELQNLIFSRISNPSDRDGIRTLLHMLAGRPRDSSELVMRAMVLMQEAGYLTAHVSTTEELLASFDVMETECIQVDTADVPLSSARQPSVDADSTISTIASDTVVADQKPTCDHTCSTDISDITELSTPKAAMLTIHDPFLTLPQSPNALRAAFTYSSDTMSTQFLKNSGDWFQTHCQPTTFAFFTPSPAMSSGSVKTDPTYDTAQTCSPASTMLSNWTNDIADKSTTEANYSHLEAAVIAPIGYIFPHISILEGLAMAHSTQISSIALLIMVSDNLICRTHRLLDGLICALAKSAYPRADVLQLPPIFTTASTGSETVSNIFVPDEAIEELLVDIKVKINIILAGVEDGIARRRARAQPIPDIPEAEMQTEVVGTANKTTKRKAVTEETDISMPVPKRARKAPLLRAPATELQQRAGVDIDPTLYRALHGRHDGEASSASSYLPPPKPKRAPRKRKVEPQPKMVIEINGKAVELD